MSTMHKALWAALTVGISSALLLAGCGTPGAPMPPSLNLPDRVTDLTAVRAGNQVTLAWTMPRRNTDKLLLKDNIAVIITRKVAEGTSDRFDSVNVDLSLPPSSAGSFIDTLPAELATGSPRSLTYRIVLRNRNGRSAGPSNAAQVLAGQAPTPVTSLSAEMRKQGVALSWASAADQTSPSTAIRLHRKLLTPPVIKPREGLLAPPQEPLEESLLVNSCALGGHAGICRALDKRISLGRSYEYRAQRVARVNVDGKTLELDGEFSAPVRVETQDIFPPEIPSGLVAVATAGENGAGPAIDLSWQSVAESDLAGYAIYRREGETPWLRISPPEPIVPLAFHDAQVQPGHTYRYAVSAIDQGGHESARSTETEETVPNP